MEFPTLEQGKLSRENITRFGGTARVPQRHGHVREVSRRKRFVSVCHDSKPSR